MANGSSKSLNEVAIEVRALAARGRFHGPAIELVKMFGLDFTGEAVQQVEAVLAAEGMATKPALSPSQPKAHVHVLVVSGSSANTGVAVEDIEILLGSRPGIQDPWSDHGEGDSRHDHEQDTHR